MTHQFHGRFKGADDLVERALAYVLAVNQCAFVAHSSALPMRHNRVLTRHRENDAKAGIAAHHVFVGFGGALQRENLGHCSNAGQQTECEGVL
jgi:hypothetical protein